MAKAKKTDLALAPDPRITALKARATKLLKNWSEVEVTDTATFESAGEGLKLAVSIRKDLKSLLDPEIKAAKKDYDDKRKVFKDVDSVIDRAEQLIRSELSIYAARQREAQQKQIDKAMDAGKDERAALIAAKPFVPAVEGVSFTEHWHAEVTDDVALIKYVASKLGVSSDIDKVFLAYVSPNIVELNIIARSKKTDDIGIPGVKGVKETSSTVRS